MNLKSLKDQELLKQTKDLVQKERLVLTQVLHHLKEVERRRLFSDLGYQSLFEYAVKELSYSEGQAGRRIQVMRLLKELPEIEEKIEKGSISLSNISQAQSYFRETQKTKGQMSSAAKLEVLESLENKSAREGQKVLVELNPLMALPKEKQKVITPTHTEVSFLLTPELSSRLEEVRSLLGVSGSTMKLSEIIDQMAQISIESLRVKKFGKKRAQRLVQASQDSVSVKATEGRRVTNGISGVQTIINKDIAQTSEAGSVTRLNKETSQLIQEHLGASNQSIGRRTLENNQSSTVAQTAALKTKLRGVTTKSMERPRLSTPTSELKHTSSSKNPRYIPGALRFELWLRDRGQCQKCKSNKGLQVDHIQPIALGGETRLDNLRLLCFQCNQRQSIKVFGAKDYGRRAKKTLQQRI